MHSNADGQNAHALWAKRTHNPTCSTDALQSATDRPNGPIGPYAPNWSILTSKHRRGRSPDAAGARAITQPMSMLRVSAKSAPTTRALTRPCDLFTSHEHA